MATKKKTQQEFYGEAPITLEGENFYGFILDPQHKKFRDAIWDPNIDIVFCNARAGTGKTTVATGVANLLVQYRKYDGIVYMMSPYGDRKQGWLPGTITEKSAVYFEAFYQALINCNVNPNTAINDESMVNQKNGTGYITCITDTYLRGTNLENKVCILDEAQNCTVAQLKKILTRVCDNTKVIVIGHDLQIDLDDPSTSGFVKYINHFKDMERAAVCQLTTNHRGWVSQHADEFEE